ncbi:MAG: DUF1311 domain-containing protein [Ruminococcaceae bacterium]|nr:DUF1311 domain-containing protein [Oscillospiraceae bacterium]
MKKISTILVILFFITTIVFSVLYFSKTDEAVESKSEKTGQENKTNAIESDCETDQQKGERETVAPNHQNDQPQSDTVELVETAEELSHAEIILGEASDFYGYSLDLEYERELALAKSNIELQEVDDKYAKKWEEKALEYLQAVEIAYANREDATVAELFKKNQAEWEEYYEKQTEFFQEIMDIEFTTGTIIPVHIVNYDLKLNRDRALELYYCCCRLWIEVEKP